MKLISVDEFKIPFFLEETYFFCASIPHTELFLLLRVYIVTRNSRERERERCEDNPCVDNRDNTPLLDETTRLTRHCKQNFDTEKSKEVIKD